MTSVVGDSISIRENQPDSLSTLTTHRYITCYWISPCISLICLITLVVTSFQFYFVAVPFSPLEQFWINGWGFIYVVLLVYPFSLQCSILIGLVYEKGLLGIRSAPSHSMAYRALLWLAIFFVWLYFTMTWLFSTDVMFWTFEYFGLNPHPVVIRYVGTLGGTTVLHLIYGLGFFFQSFRNRSRLIR